MKIYDRVPIAESELDLCPKNACGVVTGEFHPPRKGEWFVSGAVPEAYQAREDLSDGYHIARLQPLRVKASISFEFDYTDCLSELGVDFSSEEEIRQEVVEMIFEDAQNSLLHSRGKDAELVVEEADKERHVFEVVVGECTFEQAQRVLRERLGHEEDYGFHYTLQW